LRSEQDGTPKFGMSDGYARRADPTARRTGRHGPVPGWGWRDARRILQLGKKEGVSAVVLQRNGDVRFNLLSVYKPPLEARDAKVQAQQAKCQQRVAASATPVREPAVLNSAQRRSARRLQEYQQQRRAYTQGVVHSTGSPSDVAGEPAQVEIDMRNAEAAHSDAAVTGGGQKRAADETSAHEHQPSPHRAAVKSQRSGETAPSTAQPTVEQRAVVESTTRRVVPSSRSRSPTPRGQASPRGRERSVTPCRLAGQQELRSGPASSLTTRPAQAPIVSDLAMIKERQAARGGPKGSITCRFCGGSHHRMPLCRCEQPGWYEHRRPWSPSWPGHYRGSQPPSTASPK
jgi:hypothetical protein